MRGLRNIIALFPSDEAWDDRCLFLGNLATLRRWLGAVPTLVAVGIDAADIRRDIEGLGLSEELKSLMTVSKVDGPDILALLGDVSEALVIMPYAYDRSRVPDDIGDVFKEVLEGCAPPVLLLPARLSLGTPPFGSLTVPLSGEARHSGALSLGMRLAGEGNLFIDILHVTDCTSPPGPGLSTPLDEFHHEYPGLIEELIAESAPFATIRDRTRIREFRHCRGEACTELLKIMRRSPRTCIVADWKGNFAKGHATLLKRALREGTHAFLLVRSQATGHATLKVGRHFPHAA